MRKETFSKRKIGKQLVSVALLSLSLSSVASPAISVLAEESNSASSVSDASKKLQEAIAKAKSLGVEVKTEGKKTFESTAELNEFYLKQLETVNAAIKSAEERSARDKKAQNDYLAAKKKYDSEQAEYKSAKDKYDESLKTYQSEKTAYESSLTEYEKKKSEAEKVKEKTLTMNIKDVPAGVEIKPEKVVTKDLTSSKNVKEDMKAVESEFKAEESKVTAKLNEYAKTAPETPIDPAARELAAKELKSAKDWAAAQNTLGAPIGVKYVIKEVPVAGKDATVDALKTAYDKIKVQMDNEALVSQHFDSATRPGGYNWTGSKNRFLQAWSDIKQTYTLYYANDDAKAAAAAGKKS